MFLRQHACHFGDSIGRVDKWLKGSINGHLIFKLGRSLNFFEHDGNSPNPIGVNEKEPV